MHPIDTDELKTEGILAIAKNMRIGHYAVEAAAEIELLHDMMRIKEGERGAVRRENERLLAALIAAKDAAAQGDAPHVIVICDRAIRAQLPSADTCPDSHVIWPKGEPEYKLLQAENERLRTALKKYGCHTSDCEIGSERDCTCGWDAEAVAWKMPKDGMTRAE